MKKIIKRVLSLFIALAMSVSVCSLSVSAKNQSVDGKSYSKKSTYKYSTGMLWWQTNYQVDVYRLSTVECVIFSGNTAVSSGFTKHKKGYETTLSSSDSMSIGEQNMFTLGAGMNLKDWGVPLSVNASYSHSQSKQWSHGNQTSTKISSNKKDGYYSYNIALNTYKNYYKCKNLNTKKWEEIGYFGTVRDPEPYRTLVYSTKPDYKYAKIV